MPIPKPPQAVVKQANPDHKTRPLQTNGPTDPMSYSWSESSLIRIPAVQSRTTPNKKTITSNHLFWKGISVPAMNQEIPTKEIPSVKSRYVIIALITFWGRIFPSLS